jgi:hypothetical protein
MTHTLASVHPIPPPVSPPCPYVGAGHTGWWPLGCTAGRPLSLLQPTSRLCPPPSGHPEAWPDSALSRALPRCWPQHPCRRPPFALHSTARCEGCGSRSLSAAAARATYQL